MNLKNHAITLSYMIVTFICLGIYTEFVLKDILIESVKTETTKVINTNNNDLKTKIDNNFKKIDNLTSAISTAFPVKTTQENVVPIPTNTVQRECIPIGYSLVNDRRLSRRILREKRKNQTNIFH